jgi:hypothetical protein
MGTKKPLVGGNDFPTRGTEGNLFLGEGSENPADRLLDPDENFFLAREHSECADLGVFFHPVALSPVFPQEGRKALVRDDVNAHASTGKKMTHARTDPATAPMLAATTRRSNLFRIGVSFRVRLPAGGGQFLPLPAGILPSTCPKRRPTFPALRRSTLSSPVGRARFGCSFPCRPFRHSEGSTCSLPSEVV